MDILGPLVDSPEDREGIRPGVATGSLFDLGGSVSSPDAASYPLSSAYSGGSTGNLLNQSAESGDQEDRLTDACRDLEGFLLGMLLRNLGKSFGGSNLFSQTWESSFYQSMFFFELAQAICAQGPGLGIAEQIKNDIIMKTGEVS
jgi:Rod binding domain-containing protein